MPAAFLRLLFSTTLVAAVLLGCGEPDAEDGLCGIHGCVERDELDGALGKTDQSTVREEYGEGFMLVGRAHAVGELRADLDTLAATLVGRRVLAEVDAQTTRLGGRIVLRPRPDPEGGELSCANTVFSAGGYDLRRAQASDYELDDGGRLRVVAPGESVAPGSIRVLYNRACRTIYEDGTTCAPAFVFLMHELMHARNAMAGEITSHVHDPTDPMPGGSNHEEARTIGRGAYRDESPSENALRRELGLPLRVSHGTLCAPRE